MLNELEAMPGHGAIIGNQNATQNKNEGDNITSIKKVTKPKRGTSPSYLTKRLKRDAPELFSKVVSGEFFMFICFLSGGFGCCRAGKFSEHSV